MGADNSGAAEYRHQEKRQRWEPQARPFPHCAWLCGSCAALCPVRLQLHCWLMTRCPSDWSFPFTFSSVLLTYRVGGKRTGANRWAPCKSGVVFPLKSAAFPLHLHLCNWDPDPVQGDGSLFCPFLWFLLLECYYLENTFSFTDT